MKMYKKYKDYKNFNYEISLSGNGINKLLGYKSLKTAYNLEKELEKDGFITVRRRKSKYLFEYSVDFIRETSDLFKENCVVRENQYYTENIYKNRQNIITVNEK